MESEGGSPITFCLVIMLIILSFVMMSVRIENNDLRKEVEQLQTRCQELTQEVENVK